MSQTVYPHGCRYGWKLLSKGPRAPRFTLNVYTEINTVSQVADWWTLTARSVREIIHHRWWWRPSRPFFFTRCFSFLLSEGSCEINISTVVHVGLWPGSAPFHQLQYSLKVKSKSRANRVISVLAKHMPVRTRFWTIRRWSSLQNTRSRGRGWI